jgi:hypothetical protein
MRGAYAYNPVAGLFSTYEQDFAAEYRRDTYAAQRMQRRLQVLEERDYVRERTEQERAYRLKLQRRQAQARARAKERNEQWLEMKYLIDNAESAAELVRIFCHNQIPFVLNHCVFSS